MPHDPSEPIRITGGSINLSVPLAGLQMHSLSAKTGILTFTGNEPEDFVTRIRVKDGKNNVMLDATEADNVKKWTCEVFFDHPTHVQAKR